MGYKQDRQIVDEGLAHTARCCAPYIRRLLQITYILEKVPARYGELPFLRGNDVPMQNTC